MPEDNYHLHVMLVLLDQDGGWSKPTPRQKFSVTSVGVIFNQWGGLNSPPPDKSNADRHPGSDVIIIVCIYAAWYSVWYNLQRHTVTITDDQ